MVTPEKVNLFSPVREESMIGASSWTKDDRQIFKNFAALKLIESVSEIVHISTKQSHDDKVIRNLVAKVYKFISSQSYSAPVHASDCITLSVLLIELGDLNGKLTKGPILGNSMVPISARIELQKQHIIVWLKDKSRGA